MSARDMSHATMEESMATRRSALRAALLSAVFLSTLACAEAKKASSVILEGTLLIQWTGEDRFIYVPDPKNPLRFLTRRGREIRPSRMYTDGGSIPRVFWWVKGFSPWGYGPAYVLHDWLYHQHRCHLDSEPNIFSFDEANQVLDDAIGYLMITKKVDANPRARRLIKWGVDQFGQRAWDEPCDADPPTEAKGLAPITVGHIEFSK
jgi:hypothetical protein